MTHGQPDHELHGDEGSRDAATLALMSEYAAGRRRFTGRTFERLHAHRCELSGSTFEDCSFADCVLGGAMLNECTFRRCTFRRVNGIQSSFVDAVLEDCDIEEVAFGQADFYRASFISSKTKNVNFHDAFFVQATFSDSLITMCSLAGAHLGLNRFERTSLASADFEGFKLTGVNTFDEETIYRTCLDIQRLLQLAESLEYERPKDDLLRKTSTLNRFLLDSGANPQMVQSAMGGISTQQERTPSVFISYSAPDEKFASSLHQMLLAHGIDTWFAPHDIRGGRTILEQVTTAIRDHAKVILVLSEASMASNWVATEILRTRQSEQATGSRKLFPIRLVDFEKIRDWELFDADQGYDVARRIREYFIPDFSEAAKNQLQFGQAFTRLVHDLSD